MAAEATLGRKHRLVLVLKALVKKRMKVASRAEPPSLFAAATVEKGGTDYTNVTQQC